jgi:trimeric autotransporter adhesin
MALALGLLLAIWAPHQAAAAAPPAAGPSLLSATLVRAVEEAGGTQLAVRWHGEPGARLSVTLVEPDGAARVLTREHALEPGVNLLQLPIDLESPAHLRFQVYDSANVLLATLEEPILALQEISGFAWKATFFGRGLGHERQPSFHPTFSSTVLWDDGRGPALYVGGSFQSAGHHVVNGVARWDGSRWSAVGSGVRFGHVNALAVYRGDLIAGGTFTQAGGVTANRIARWNGAEWSPLAGPSGEGVLGEVLALAVHQGDLVVGGGFVQAGGVTANGIARWNGAEWSSFAAGIAGMVSALATYDGDLVAAGHFGEASGVTVNSIARWDGERWLSLGTGVEGFWGGPGWVYALAVYEGELIAGGTFSYAGEVSVLDIARWDGERWAPIDVVFVRDEGVWGLTVHRGELIAASPAPPFVRSWNGSTSSILPGLQGEVFTLGAYEDLLLAGGSFHRAGASPVDGVAGWNGIEWSPALLDESVSDRGVGDPLWSQVEALIVFDGDLIVGGEISQAGGVLVDGLARWDGRRWSPFESGGDGGRFFTVRALELYQGDLVASGQFLEAGNFPFKNVVARWDGTQWLALSGPSGTGFDGEVVALSAIDGSLVAGGGFTEVDGLTVNFVARWDGSQWSAVAGPSGTGMNDSVLALTVHDGHVVAGGRFTQAGGVTVNRVARWDGDQWLPFSGPAGTGVNGQVLAFTVYENDLVAGGDFSMAGGLPASRAARWDGSQWQAFQGSLPVVRALTVYQGTLIAGASFWDGSAWRFLSGPAGFGTNGAVHALTVYDGHLVAGGDFTITGGVPNRRVGLFGPRCGPSSRVLCLDDQLGDQRFELTLDFETTQAGGLAGQAQAVPLAGLGVTSGGLFHFGDATNPEVVAKVLDGCAINGHFWVFQTAGTNVGFHLLVRDNMTGKLFADANQDLTAAVPLQDTAAFPCGPGPAGGSSSWRSALSSLGAWRVTSVPLLPSAPRSGHGCPGGEHVLCIADRFQVEVDFETSQAGGLAGKAPAIPLAAVGVDRGGLFHFGNPTNPEVLLKVLDGCALNDHYWVFYSAATNVGLEVRVTDTLTGEEATYENPDLTPAIPVQDTAALPCE